MATITATDMTGAGDRVVNTTTLDGASDGFTYQNGDATLILINGTGASVTPTLTGANASSSFGITGVGDIDLSAGYTTDAIADGTTVAIPLSTIRFYLDGDITITSGSGLDAQLLVY